VKTESVASTSPKASADSGSSRPAGIGRLRVRVISASMSASYHMLSAPDAPAPTAIARSEAKPISGCGGVGASNRPASAVNTTSDITRGLRSAK
jgi:hypothetical protein